MKNLKSVSVQVIDSDIALLLPNGVYEIKQMEPRSRLRKIVFVCIALTLFGIFGFGYFSPDKVTLASNYILHGTKVICHCSFQVRALSNRDLQFSLRNDNIGKPINNLNNKVGLSYDDMLTDDFVFDMDSRDVMVFLHMQKTGEIMFAIM